MKIDWKKKYEEVLSLAKSYYGKGQNEFLDTLFPELSESEDERIRKELIDFVNHYRHNTDLTSEQAEWCKKALAYLEKQKEQKPEENSVYPHSLDEAIQLYYYTYGNGKGGFDYLSLPKFQDIVEDFVKSYGQKPVEWSEEDEIYLQDALWCIKQASTIARGENDMRACWSAERWLKSLKNRGNFPKSNTNSPSWSEEDEDNLRRVTRIIEDNDSDWKELIGWLKSLRPSWKPSEEQINALDDAIFFDRTVFRRKKLVSLLEDLKKLM